MSKRQAGTPEGVREGNREAADARETELMDVQALLATRQGRRFMWRYLGKCGIFVTSFNNSGSITAFNEGMRNIGLMLLADINEAAPEMYQVMLNESKEKKND